MSNELVVCNYQVALLIMERLPRLERLFPKNRPCACVTAATSLYIVPVRSPCPNIPGLCAKSWKMHLLFFDHDSPTACTAPRRRGGMLAEGLVCDGAATISCMDAAMSTSSLAHQMHLTRV